MKNVSKKSSIKISGNLTKAVVGLIMSCGANAFAQNQVVTKKNLIENNLDRSTVQQLLDEKILLRSKNNGEFVLNNIKVAEVIEKSGDQELTQFLSWLKIVAHNNSVIKLKKLKDMNLSTQDGGINQGN
jgi:hypothetical protein